jgi:hypothetical protein
MGAKILDCPAGHAPGKFGRAVVLQHWNTVALVKGIGEIGIQRRRAGAIGNQAGQVLGWDVGIE